MAFGQQPGPPATARQVQELTALVHAAGHTDLRDARGLGLTQRQAGGRFTRDEADALIARLQLDAEGADGAGPEGAGSGDGTALRVGPSAGAVRREADTARRLGTVPAELLAAELQRRGWVVLEP